MYILEIALGQFEYVKYFHILPVNYTVLYVYTMLSLEEEIKESINQSLYGLILLANHLTIERFQ